MFTKSRRHLTYANVVSSVCLFVALGGSAYAAAHIGSGDIVNNSVRSKDIRNGGVSTRDVRNGSLLASDFRSDQLPAGARGPKGDTGHQGRQGEEGLPGKDGQNGVLGYRRVSAPMANTALGAGSGRQATASCAADEVVTGGGYYGASTSTTDQPHLTIQASTPVEGTPTGWYVFVRNTSQASRTPQITVWAICAKQPQ